MASLSGTQIRNTYSGILKTSDSAGVTDTLKTVSDGTGADTALQISSTAVRAAKLEITSVPTSSINTVLVWDSNSKEILSRTLPTFETVEVTTSSITNGGSITIADSAGNSNVISIVDNGVDGGINVAHSNGAFTISGGSDVKSISGITNTLYGFGIGSLNAGQSGTVFGVDGDSGSWTADDTILKLPAATVGINYKVILETTPTDKFRISVATGDTDEICGMIRVHQDGVDNVTHIQALAYGTGGTYITIDPSSATKGGMAGSVVNITCLKAGKWYVDADLISSGTLSGAVNVIGGTP